MSDRELVNVDANAVSHLERIEPRVEVLHVAVGVATVLMSRSTAVRVKANEIDKGDVLGCARIAGIQAAKRATDLIPSVLPVSVGGVTVEFELLEDRIEVTSTVEAFDRTGVTMQALTASAVAALTIYDMCKAIDRSMVITALTLSNAQRDGASI